jgi:hypothetical protein
MRTAVQSLSTGAVCVGLLLAWVAWAGADPVDPTKDTEHDWYTYGAITLLFGGLITRALSSGTLRKW